jgi:AmmeMemoRadiSam system protein B/AmmeMemoRadiSam system protein A
MLSALGLAVLSACSSSGTSETTRREVAQVRRPAVAGTFYPGGAQELGRVVDEFLKNADTPETRVEGRVIGIISPHAGYAYSGQVAAHAYSAVRGGDYDVVILIGPSHRAPVAAAAVYTSGSFSTPLGSVPVDERLAEDIVSLGDDFADDPGAHVAEHSLEVQLPVLQRVLKDFKIVPMVTRDLPPDRCEQLGRALAASVKGRKALFVGSSDLSHYPAYDDANRVDRETVESWKTMDLEAIYSKEEAMMRRPARNLATTACGSSAVMITMAACKALGADAVAVLNYANSGDVSGDKTEVVGYAAAAIYKSSGGGAGEGPSREAVVRKPAAAGDGGALGRADRKKLLSVARVSIDAVLRRRPLPDFKLTESSLSGHQGAFVTLHRDGQLRGCIGRFTADEPLYKVVSQMAVAAATQDTRFPPVTLPELDKVEIEISVLSPLRKMGDVSELELGKHGIYVMKGPRGGCYLPQVADETGWSKEEFLRHCCLEKAGLESDAWKKDADVYLFTAEVFSEGEVQGK